VLPVAWRSEKTGIQTSVAPGKVKPAGTPDGQVLPRVGPWMNTVKAGFGVMLIGVAIWMMDRVLPGGVTLVLWALLVFLTGVFLGAFEPLPATPTPVRRLAKGVGMLACLYGAIMLVGATLGGPVRTPDDAAADHAAWKQAGATHVTIHTMGAGLKTADEHIGYLRRFRNAIG